MNLRYLFVGDPDESLDVSQGLFPSKTGSPMFTGYSMTCFSETRTGATPGLNPFSPIFTGTQTKASGLRSEDKVSSDPGTRLAPPHRIP